MTLFESPREPPTAQEMAEKDAAFVDKIRALINSHSRENASDTPDFILAVYLLDCLEAFDRATRRRTEWYQPLSPADAEGPTS